VTDSAAAVPVEAVPVCPVCGEQERTTLYDGLTDRLFDVPGRWTLMRCACGAAYLDPRPTGSALARLYESYCTHGAPAEGQRGAVARLRRAIRNGYLNERLGYRLGPAAKLGSVVLAPFAWQRRRARLIVRDLPLARNRPRLLDVGCGNGAFLLEMRAAGWDVEGLEPDGHATAIARALGLVVHEGVLGDAPLARRSFDAITMSHVLEHLPDLGSDLRRCRDLLRSDGRLWIATPNLDSPGHRRYGRDWVGLDGPRHLVLFTPSSLRSLLQSSGFIPEFLRPGRIGWLFCDSEKPRAERLGVSPRKLRTRALAAAHDLRTRADPCAGDELIVLARPLAD
jgi:SAM-dependent methyltransferase